MNDCEKGVLRSFHCQLVETLDPYELRAFLYERGVLPNATFLGEDPVRTRRAERFLEYIIDECTFSLFLESLSKDNAFRFLADKLQTELEKVKKETSVSQHVPFERKEPLFTTWRGKAIAFRHELKRYALLGDTRSFIRESQAVVDNWKSRPKHALFLADNQELADMYFMAVDATMERRRLIYDKNLYKDKELFDTMLRLSPFTSSATLPQVMYLARYGSALLMAGRPVEEALGYVEQAKQRLQTLPACRESGVVRYIEYNMLISKKYEQNPTNELRQKLLEIGRESIEHFCREQEIVGKDFRRMVLLKLANLHLGIGLFLNNMNSIAVTEENKKQAEIILQEIRKPDNWRRMETRWIFYYHTANSRLLQLQGNTQEALEEIRKAAMHASKGQFQKELVNIEETKYLLGGRRGFVSMYLVVVFILCNLLLMLLCWCYT